MAKNLNSNLKILNLGTILVIVSLLFLSAKPFASAQTTPPAFPSCQLKLQEGEGDWEHFDHGIHGIPGIGNLEGSDDVYSLNSKNFIQCFCPAQGEQGWETHWWNVDEAGLTDEEIDQFVNSGWILENGSGWNLFDDRYLARNQQSSCAEPTPTPTPTSTPSPSPTPTPTTTPNPTPTPKDEDESRCVSLSASPTSGTAPLTVKFTASGFDPHGDIQEYEFNFGDASGGQPQVWNQAETVAFHRYEEEGEFVASLKVKDSRGNWRDGSDDCRVDIEVDDEPRVLGTSVPKQLPKTGAPAAVVFVLTGLAGTGAYLYKRFKLV